jgi:hypothetical protein
MMYLKKLKAGKNLVVFMKADIQNVMNHMSA